VSITLTEEEVHEVIETGDKIATESWRWGTASTYVFERDGKHYKTTIRLHSTEGFQDETASAIEVTPVDKVVTVREWVRVDQTGSKAP
jgi:hypothetical protein